MTSWESWLQWEASFATYIAFLLTLACCFFVKRQSEATLRKIVVVGLAGYALHFGTLMLFDTTFVHLFPTYEEVWSFWRRGLARNLLCGIQVYWWVALWHGAQRETMPQPRPTACPLHLDGIVTRLTAKLEQQHAETATKLQHLERILTTLLPPPL